MSLEPSPPSEAVPPAPAQVEPPAPAGDAPVATAAAQPEKPRKSQPRKFWDAAKTIALIASMVIDLILIVAVVILANQVGAIKLQRPVPAGNAGENIDAVLAERVEQVELERSDAGCLEDQVHLPEFAFDPGRRNLPAVDVAAADMGKPLRTGAVPIHDIEAVDRCPAQAQSERRKKPDGPEARH